MTYNNYNAILTIVAVKVSQHYDTSKIHNVYNA